MTKHLSDRGYGLTPGGWKFVAVAYSLITFLDNLAEAHSIWTWMLAAVSAVSFCGLLVFGHRPSLHKLWSDRVKREES